MSHALDLQASDEDYYRQDKSNAHQHRTDDDKYCVRQTEVAEKIVRYSLLQPLTLIILPDHPVRRTDRDMLIEASCQQMCFNSVSVFHFGVRIKRHKLRQGNSASPTVYRTLLYILTSSLPIQPRYTLLPPDVIDLSFVGFSRIMQYVLHWILK